MWTLNTRVSGPNTWVENDSDRMDAFALSLGPGPEKRMATRSWGSALLDAGAPETVPVLGWKLKHPGLLRADVFFSGEMWKASGMEESQLSPINPPINQSGCPPGRCCL